MSVENTAASGGDAPEPEAETVRRSVMALSSDPRKTYRQDPGRPEVCEVFERHRIWNAAQASAIRLACGRGMLGCGDCRERLIRTGRARQA